MVQTCDCGDFISSNIDYSSVFIGYFFLLFQSCCSADFDTISRSDSTW